MAREVELPLTAEAGVPITVRARVDIPYVYIPTTDPVPFDFRLLLDGATTTLVDLLGTSSYDESTGVLTLESEAQVVPANGATEVKVRGPINPDIRFVGISTNSGCTHSWDTPSEPAYSIPIV